MVTVWPRATSAWAIGNARTLIVPRGRSPKGPTITMRILRPGGFHYTQLTLKEQPADRETRFFRKRSDKTWFLILSTDTIFDITEHACYNMATNQPSGTLSEIHTQHETRNTKHVFAPVYADGYIGSPALADLLREPA